MLTQRQAVLISCKEHGFVVKADLGLAPGSSYEDLGLLPKPSARYGNLIPSLSVTSTIRNICGRAST